MKTQNQDTIKAEPRFADTIALFDQDELCNFKSKTDELMQNLHTGDLSGVLHCINEINRINDENLYRIIGKITRGLHNAISDLQLSSTADNAGKNRTRTGLGYVIDVTADAARTTLDMTDKARSALTRLAERMAREDELLASLAAAAADDARLGSSVAELTTLLQANRADVGQLRENVTAIIVAQNFQDLASQSIMKSISNIRSVETSLIALTRHTNVLRQLSQFTANPEALNESDTEELCNNLGKLDLAPENDHMDQDDVDNLLSSLGF